MAEVVALYQGSLFVRQESQGLARARSAVKCQRGARHVLVQRGIAEEIALRIAAEVAPKETRTVVFTATKVFVCFK